MKCGNHANARCIATLKSLPRFQPQRASFGPRPYPCSRAVSATSSASLASLRISLLLGPKPRGSPGS